MSWLLMEVDAKREARYEDCYEHVNSLMKNAKVSDVEACRMLDIDYKRYLEAKQFLMNVQNS